jgi:hypothetical protein
MLSEINILKRKRKKTWINFYMLEQNFEGPSLNFKETFSVQMNEQYTSSYIGPFYECWDYLILLVR